MEERGLVGREGMSKWRVREAGESKGVSEREERVGERGGN